MGGRLHDAAGSIVRENDMKVAITGASGLVGSTVAALLRQQGHDVAALVRRSPRENEIEWDPAAGSIESEKLEGIDAVVHLAGENIAEGRWNDAKKKRILDSRVGGTKLVSETLAGLNHKPSVFVSASAIGFYGDQRPAPVDETAERGEGFLAEVCQAWEDASQPAVDAGIRTVNLRIGVVLSSRGGALSKMLTPFKLCLGGIVGSGRQVWSWIAIDDLAAAIVHAINSDSLSGPVNATAPNASTNAEFTKALGHVLGRPTIFPMPTFAARLAFGEMADALLLSSSRVKPARLLESNFEFKFPEIEPALRAAIK